jgi:asparagine synthase (glutamine-hydrolysing)
MCGIAGFVSPALGLDAPALRALAGAMADEIAHRGPDDQGTYADVERGLGFGFRRLSIIDLSPAGHQPMASASGRTVIIFNGEIYNTADLRPSPAGAGIVFRGHSDTEVLLETIEMSGIEDALARAIGMYAFAVYDRVTGRLHLARDRVGKKPLYIGRFGGSTMFASELRSVRRHPDFRAEIDPRALAAYIRFGYVPNPLSIYRNVTQLPPGGRGTLTRSGEWSVERFWRIEEVAALQRDTAPILDEAEAVDQLEALLRDAVGRRMVADVPLGAFLSGGIDSSLVVALMQAQSRRPVRTFSIGFDVPEFDEAPYARAVARHLGTDHEELYVTAEDGLNVIPSLPEIYDEPFADSSQIPTFLVAHLARRHVTVALSGDGGDESFAGYSRYGHLGSSIGLATGSAGLLAPLARTAGCALRAPTAASIYRRLPPVFRARADRWLDRLGAAEGPQAMEQLYRSLVQQGVAPQTILCDAEEEPAAWWQGALADRYKQPVERAQMLDLLTYLPDDILVKVDRASMAVGLEVRAPLLDHRVMEFAWRLPMAMKSRGDQTKWALRQVLYRSVPRELIDRPKTGFGVPIDSWLRGPLHDWAEDLLAPRHLAADGLFDPQAVRQLWGRHLAGEQWQYPLWTVLQFQAWKRRWLS